MRRVLIPGALAAVALVVAITLTINTADVYTPSYVQLIFSNQSTLYNYAWWPGVNATQLQLNNQLLLKFGTTYRAVDANEWASIYFVGHLIVYINATNTAKLSLYDPAYNKYYSTTVDKLTTGKWGPYDVRIIQRTAEWTLFRLENREGGSIDIDQPVTIRFP